MNKPLLEMPTLAIATIQPGVSVLSLALPIWDPPLAERCSISVGRYDPLTHCPESFSLHLECAMPKGQTYQVQTSAGPISTTIPWREMDLYNRKAEHVSRINRLRSTPNPRLP